MILNNDQRTKFKLVMKKYYFNTTLWLVDNPKYENYQFIEKKQFTDFLYDNFGINGEHIFAYKSPLALIDAVIRRYNYGKREKPVTQERRDKLKQLFERLLCTQ